MTSLLLLAILAASPAPAPASCALSTSDRAWLDRSVRGWVVTRRDLLGAKAARTQDAVIFDRRCVLRSDTALRTGAPRWVARPIAGKTVRVGEQDIPVGVVSATVGDDSGTRFVMSTPSVWAASGVKAGSFGLDRLTSAVLMHEASHVFQMDTYGKDIERLQAEMRLSDDAFNDDAIQARFAKESAFAASIDRETALFFDAANARSDAEARSLASAARAMMKARAARYYVGEQAYQARAEDLWLTMEGSAQWAGYRWLSLPARSGGGGVGEAEAMKGFAQRGQSWTQKLGIAVALTVDRLDRGRWKAHVFGDGRRTLLQSLDGALAAPVR